MDTETINLPCFKFKGLSVPVTTMQLLDNDLKNFKDQIAAQVEKAPNFFNNTPVIIDLQIIADKAGSLDFAQLLSTIREHRMIPIGIKGGRQEHQLQALSNNLAIFQASSKQEEVKKQEPTKRTQNKSNNLSTAKIIKQPVRSGQQIYAKNTDLIILGTVSAGAECLADGNIHIYGALRGRALAGVQGDTSTHIFCKSLEAEIISIAGQYQVNETLRNLTIWQKQVDIFIDEDDLKISPL